MPKKRLAAQLGLDPKTVRRYLHAAAARAHVQQRIDYLPKPLQPRRRLVAAAAVGCKRVFGGSSHGRPAAAAGMPESKHLKGVAGHPVAQVVSNPRKPNSSNSGQRRSASDRSDCWLHTKEIKDPVKFFVDRVGSGKPILGPPGRGGRDLRLSVVRNLNAQRSVHGTRRNRSRNASQETT